MNIQNLFILATLMAVPADAAVDQNTRQAAVRTGAAALTEVAFDEGSAALTSEAQRELDRLIIDARTKGIIKEVRVVAWADQEYPAQGATIAKSQKDLAQKRAESIDDYPEKNQNVANVKMYNMAERPTSLQKVFKTSDSRTKEAMERSGAAPTNTDDTGFFGLRAKASHSIVMVYFK